VIPTERLTNERLEKIVADLRRRADVLIIAAPPPHTHSDTLLYAAVADQAIVVASAGRTHMDALQMTLASIRAMKAPVLGLVLHGVDGSSA